MYFTTIPSASLFAMGSALKMEFTVLIPSFQNMNHRLWSLRPAKERATNILEVQQGLAWFIVPGQFFTFLTFYFYWGFKIDFIFYGIFPIYNCI